MYACFHPINIKTFTTKDKLKFQYIQDIVIKCNINRHILLDIIQFTFAEKCKLTSFGFNARSEEFCAKKFTNNKFLLHFTIKIESYDYNSSIIKITPFVGDINELSKIINIIKEIINLYEII